MHKYAIIGFGGLGKMHLCNLKKLEAERGDFKLAAICGTTAENARKSTKINLGEANVAEIDFSDCHFYDDYRAMLANEELDFVFSVLPTYLHKEVGLYVLSKGVDLFSEKPMALTTDACKELITTAKNNEKHLMIGHCLRFSPAYSKLKEYIRNCTFGKVRRAQFCRYSQMPLWTWNNWILDAEKSGGCVLDMHIHDIDLINWYFGMPNSVSSVMTEKKLKKESISSQLVYDDFVVIAEADWALPQTFPFTARCRVDFENASVCIESDVLTVYTDSESYSPEISTDNAFYEEEKAFLDLVIDGKECSITSPESIYDSVRLVMAELDSAKSGSKVMLSEEADK